MSEAQLFWLIFCRRFDAGHKLARFPKELPFKLNKEIKSLYHLLLTHYIIYNSLPIWGGTNSHCVILFYLFIY